MAESLWGEEFVLIENTKEKAKAIEKKKSSKKKMTAEKIISAKATSIEEKLRTVRTEVYRILGVYKEKTQLINTYEHLKDFIDKAVELGEIAVDTETNHSLDPLTCKLMGACLYIPTEKQAYVPLNHTDLLGNLLKEQVTKEQLAEQMERLKDVKIIYHNAKFDYSVIKCTLGVELVPYWDTMIGAQMLDENEPASLKSQYISKIDPSIEKYSIEHLFKIIDYEYVEPEVFALYAATDSMMTYKLYQWQKEKFLLPENKRVFDVFWNIEMPVILSYADMELDGILIDKDYSARLKTKYEKLIEESEKGLYEALKEYDDQIAKWRRTSEANEKPKVYMSSDDIWTEEDRAKFPNKDDKGWFKYGKTKNEQLSDPVSLSSPQQLSILLYDILKTPVIDKKNPRGTGEKIIEQIDLPLCKLLTKHKKLQKLMTAFVEPLPGKFTHQLDGRVHCDYKQLGAKTGRCSCTEPNLQQVPSKSVDIRMMFKATIDYKDVEETNDCFEVPKISDVLLSSGEWINAKEIEVGMEVVIEDEILPTVSKVERVEDNDTSILVYVA